MKTLPTLTVRVKDGDTVDYPKLLEEAKAEKEAEKEVKAVAKAAAKAKAEEAKAEKEEKKMIRQMLEEKKARVEKEQEDYFFAEAVKRNRKHRQEVVKPIYARDGDLHAYEEKKWRV